MPVATASLAVIPGTPAYCEGMGSSGMEKEDVVEDEVVEVVVGFSGVGLGAFGVVVEVDRSLEVVGVDEELWVGGVYVGKALLGCDVVLAAAGLDGVEGVDGLAVELEMTALRLDVVEAGDVDEGVFVARVLEESPLPVQVDKHAVLGLPEGQ